MDIFGGFQRGVGHLGLFRVSGFRFRDQGLGLGLVLGFLACLVVWVLAGGSFTVADAFSGIGCLIHVFRRKSCKIR